MYSSFVVECKVRHKLGDESIDIVFSEKGGTFGACIVNNFVPRFLMSRKSVFKFSRRFLVQRILNMPYLLSIVIILSLSQSTNGHRRQMHAISPGAQPVASICCQQRFAYRHSTGQRASYPTLAELWSPLKNSLLISVIGCLADLASSLPHHLTFSTSYILNLGSLSDNLISYLVLQRNSEHCQFHNSLNYF